MSVAPTCNAIAADIDEDTVDMVPNYDGSTEQPSVLPARFPNLLVNGSQGIAVGMATNIPPHNLGEVIDATVHLIDNPDATSDDLMEFVKGPDFPTGGSILGRAGIIDAYRTGRGSVKMRATATIDEASRGEWKSLSPNCRIKRVVLRLRLASPNWSTTETSKESPTSTTGHPVAELPGDHVEARRKCKRCAEQPLQTHATSDQFLDQHGRPR